MTIEEVKQVSLDVLMHFHDFCVNNDLHYSMWGGSLIGAIRHKGYIPWDDDIDLCMPRPDFDRFFEIYKDSDEYACFNYNRNGALLSWGRICDMKRTCSYTNHLWTKKKTGVYISIFPIDGVEPNYESMLTRFDKCVHYCGENYRLRSIFKPLSKYGTLKENLLAIVRRMRYCYKLRKYYNLMLANVKNHNEECHRYDFDKMQYVMDMAFASNRYRPQCLWPKEDFLNYLLVEFEGHPVYVIEGYDRNLRLRFGDYMQLPPIEKRVAIHTSTRFYWK